MSQNVYRADFNIRISIEDWDSKTIEEWLVEKMKQEGVAFNSDDNKKIIYYYLKSRINIHIREYSHMFSPGVEITNLEIKEGSVIITFLLLIFGALRSTKEAVDIFNFLSNVLQRDFEGMLDRYYVPENNEEDVLQKREQGFRSVWVSASPRKEIKDYFLQRRDMSFSHSMMLVTCISTIFMAFLLYGLCEYFMKDMERRYEEKVEKELELKLEEKIEKEKQNFIFFKQKEEYDNRYQSKDSTNANKESDTL